MNCYARFAVSAVCLLTLILGQAVFAGGHTWKVKEIFSNADGTIQYVEVWEANGTAGEIGTANHNVSSNSHFFTIPSNVASPTTFKSLLLATQGFADLNVVRPDYIIADNFFSLTTDSISYVPLHTMTFLAGQLPTDGVMALAADLTTVVNSPENYAGQGGSVDVGPTPPGVPAAGLTPLTISKTVPNASQLLLSFDTASCNGNSDHQVIYGFGTGIPAVTGGTFTVTGANCAIGSSPFDWIGAPDPSVDSSGLLWFLVQATDGSMIEGSWGKDGNGDERVGPGPNGSSGQCVIADKDLSNVCGQ